MRKKRKNEKKVFAGKGGIRFVDEPWGTENDRRQELGENGSE